MASSWDWCGGKPPFWINWPVECKLRVLEEWEERAAIIEYHGCKPRKTAEWWAYNYVARMYGADVNDGGGKA